MKPDWLKSQKKLSFDDQSEDRTQDLLGVNEMP